MAPLCCLISGIYRADNYLNGAIRQIYYLLGSFTIKVILF
nr:MAG TPA: hypothetical protein [Caudoviricetes sp.]